MSRETWTTTMFGVYLDLDDIEKAFPEADINGSPEDMEELISEATGLDAWTHLVDDKVGGIGIGFAIEDRQSSAMLIAGVTKAEKTLKNIEALALSTKADVFTMECSR